MSIRSSRAMGPPGRSVGCRTQDAARAPGRQPSDFEVLARENAPNLADYRERVRLLIEKTRRIGARPILITQPLLWGPVTDPTTGIDLASVAQTVGGRRASSLVFWRVLEQYNDVAGEVGREAGVTAVPLARTLPKDSKYLIDEMHFSVAGAARVAEIVARTVCPVLAAEFPRFRSDAGCDSLAGSPER
jgi:hypothetical protein